MFRQNEDHHMQHEFKAGKKGLQVYLRKKRQLLNQKLRNIANEFASSQHSSQNWIEDLFMAVSNLVIQILNLIFSVFNLQLPHFGSTEINSPTLDKKCEPLIEKIISNHNEPLHTQKSRPMAVKNYLRRKNLGLSISQPNLKNISQADLSTLNSLKSSQIKNLVEQPASDILRALQNLPNQKLDMTSCTLLDEEDFSLHPETRLIF